MILINWEWIPQPIPFVAKGDTLLWENLNQNCNSFWSCYFQVNMANLRKYKDGELKTVNVDEKKQIRWSQNKKKLCKELVLGHFDVIFIFMCLIRINVLIKILYWHLGNSATAISKMAFLDDQFYCHLYICMNTKIYKS